MGLKEDEELAAKNATGERVAAIEAKIKYKFFATAYEAYHHIAEAEDVPELKLLTFCTIVLENGFTVTGQSACADAKNFDAEKGKHFAYEDAVHQAWRLEGYLLRQRLSEQESDDKIARRITGGND